MAVMPGAHFLNAVQGTLMARYDIVCIHTIVGYAPANAAHFSIRADGYVWQSRDTKYRSAANYNGNPRVVAIENEDMGVAYGAWNTSDGHQVPGFTAAQIESIAQACAWVHRTHGTPLIPCPDSKPGSRGIAYHRQGIPSSTNFAGYQYGGVVSGGEIWTTSPGKVCPGDRRITQLITQIIPRARQIAGLDPGGFLMSLTDTEQRTLYNRVLGFLRQRWYQVKDGKVTEVPEGTAGAIPAAALDSLDGDYLRRWIEAVDDKVDVLDQKVDAVTLAVGDAVQRAVADYLAANPPAVNVDYAAIAAAVNDDADRRARDNNSFTGPVS